MTRAPDNAPTPAWKTFNMLSFAVAAGMMAGGIWSLEASFAAKGFYAMASLMLVHTSISLTKTMRDADEAARIADAQRPARDPGVREGVVARD